MTQNPPYPRLDQDTIDLCVDAHLDDLKSELLEQYELIRSRCESPIEDRLLLQWMMFELELPWSNTGKTLFDFSTLDFTYGDKRKHSYECADVFLQADVLGYRVDFLIDWYDDKYGRHWMVVECDGHDFHERTKEQAARDRRRDRKMATRGIIVLRFTGSEIWADAYSCIGEIQCAICDLTDRTPLEAV